MSSEKAKGKTPYDRIKDWLENPAMREVLQRTLPPGTAVDAWVTAALTTVRTSGDVAKCEPLSTIGALMTLASLGLRLEGPLGQAYLQARPVKKKVNGKWEIVRYECQAGIGYRGMMAIARRDPNVRDIEATIVHQADQFEFKRGTEMWLEHRWNVNMDAAARGPIVAVYAGIRYRDGYYSFDVFPIADVMALRDKILRQTYIEIEYTQDGQEVFWRTFQDGGKKVVDPSEPGALPWIGHPLPMIQKTAIRWASKYWNLTPEMDRAAQLVALDDAGMSQGLAQAALGVMPDHIRHAAEQTEGIALDPANRAQAATARTGASLTARMLAEARGQQVQDGQPEPALPQPEDADQRPEALPEDASQAEPPMTEEEKLAAVQLELEEAAREEAARVAAVGATRDRKAGK